VQSIVYPSVLIMCLIHWMLNDSKENCIVSPKVSCFFPAPSLFTKFEAVHGELTEL
jgi:hypothetical protein